MHPILFHLFGFPVYGYGAMLGLSCVAGAHLAVYLSVRSGITHKQAWALVMTVIVVGIVGGRIHDLAVTGNLSLDELTKVVHSGRTAYGAFLSATLAGVIATRAMGVPFWRFADAAAPTMALGLGLTRIGCFFAGCDYGFQSAAWGVAFPARSPAWNDQLARGLIEEGAHASLPVFPAQLLASLAGFVIFGLCMALWFRRPRRSGDVTLLFFGAYGLARAGLEALRDDAGRGTLMGLSTSTTIGLVSAAVALALVLVPFLRDRRPEAGEILEWFEDGQQDAAAGEPAAPPPPA
ncbi:MAG: prolipoprotein diacylglyceryl transferase [Planctomycetota bacterium]